MSRRAWLWGVALMAAATACSLDLVDPSGAATAPTLWVSLESDSTGAWRLFGSFRSGVDDAGVEWEIVDPALVVAGMRFYPDSVLDERGSQLIWEAALPLSNPPPDTVGMVGPRVSGGHLPEEFLLPLKRVVQPPSVSGEDGDIVVVFSADGAEVSEPTSEDWRVEVREWSGGRVGRSFASQRSTAPLPDSLRLAAEWLPTDAADSLRLTFWYRRRFKKVRQDSTAFAEASVSQSFIWYVGPPGGRTQATH